LCGDPPLDADSLRELALQLSVDPETLERTVAEFNALVRAGTFEHAALDGLQPTRLVTGSVVGDQTS